MLLLWSSMSFLIKPFQGIVYVLELRGERGKIATYIGGHFLATVDAFIFLDMQGYFFGDGVVMAKKTAAEGAELVAIAGEHFFHWNRF